MNKRQLGVFIPIFLIVLSLFAPAYSATEYKEVRYIDLTGDLEDEIIIKSNHNAGTGHYIEMMRVYKENAPIGELSLIFMIRTLDSYWSIPTEEPARKRNSDNVKENIL